jgi:hypothetical protein
MHKFIFCSCFTVKLKMNDTALPWEESFIWHKSLKQLVLYVYGSVVSLLGTLIALLLEVWMKEQNVICLKTLQLSIYYCFLLVPDSQSRDWLCDWYFAWFSSIHPSKCQDIVASVMLWLSFYILSNLFVNHPVEVSYVLCCNADVEVVKTLNQQGTLQYPMLPRLSDVWGKSWKIKAFWTILSRKNKLMMKF